jgi:cell division protein ZapE
MSGGTFERYRSLVKSGELKPDPAQLHAAEKLQHLGNALARGSVQRFGRLRGPFPRKRQEPPKGLYLFGGVGRGKTLLLDLFFEEVKFGPKHRLHFQEFMAETHEGIELARKNAADPVEMAAGKIAAEAALLCFDELEITDIADAMIVGRLFRHLFERGMVVVATSNSAPRDLYRGGLNRQLFQPFIRMLEERMEILEVEAAKDYRLERLTGGDLYFVPADESARAAMDACWLRLTGQKRGVPQSLVVKGRNIAVPETALGVARFPFADICEAPLGPLDYQRIAHSFHTLMIDNIPSLGPEKRNAARRLITLIDALYDNGVGLIASAEAEPDALHLDGDGGSAFARTASRLMEMRSETYLAGRRWRP